MLSDALKFWESIAGKVKQLIRGETQNAFRCERYEVSTAPNGSVMGVKKPFGNEILLPYSQEVSEASVGDPVLVVWWNSMSNAKVYYFANGYEGTTGGGGGGDEDSGVVIATISLPLSWNNSGSGYYTVTPTLSGATVTTTSKVDLQPTQAQTLQLQSDGVTALYVENNAGVLTAYAIGNAPTAAMTMQCTLTGTAGTQTGTVVVDHDFTLSFPAGTIGTRGAQGTFTLPYPISQLRSISIIYTDASNYYIPVAFASGTTLYCNYYRATASASSAYRTTVRMVFEI